jgi:hypothetical protein
MLGAGDRDFLEHIAAGIHQRDHSAGQGLVERKCRAIDTSAVASTRNRPARKSRTKQS